MTPMKTRLHTTGLTLAAGALTLAGGTAQAAQVFATDLIVQGSACIGFDCATSESFGFDTLRLKENNLRIKFQDTSVSASFPTNDWQITANDSSNGGANKFSIDDIDGGRTPFTIEAGARSNALFVEASGDIGIGTNTPVADLHVKTGNTPTLRLEQDGTSGFNAQTWDLAGNEANLFLREVTNGSDLPFRIFPDAGTNALVIEGTTGDIGMGTNGPDAELHVIGDILSDAADTGAGDASLHIRRDTGSSFQRMMHLENTGTGGIAFRLTTNGLAIDTNNTAGVYRINFNDGDDQELQLDTNGALVIDGALTENSDKNNKMAIVPVDSQDILTKVTELPLAHWTYKHDAEAGIRHIGPMAQDFYALFGTGKDATGISTLDTSGVALAAIQALSQQNAELRARLDTLEAQIAN